MAQVILNHRLLLLFRIAFVFAGLIFMLDAVAGFKLTRCSTPTESLAKNRIVLSKKFSIQTEEDRYLVWVKKCVDCYQEISKKNPSLLEIRAVCNRKVGCGPLPQKGQVMDHFTLNKDADSD